MNGQPVSGPHSAYKALQGLMPLDKVDVFVISVPRGGGMCVMYTEVDFRGFVTRRAGARKKIVWWN